jgi:N-acetylmuramoyl-L-alanine amidase
MVLPLPAQADKRALTDTTLGAATQARISKKLARAIRAPVASGPEVDMLSSWLRTCLGLWSLMPAAALAGAPAPAAPGLSITGPRQPARVEVLSDGLALEVRDALVGRMIGPICPGELHFVGSFVPALLPAASREELARRLPQAWSRQRSRADPAPADDDRLLVVIDPGHGGSEEGCRGVAGTLEKGLVLRIAQRIETLLDQLPSVQVIMTRERDEHISLWDRVDLANQLDADLFISVHANAFVRPDFGGVETDRKSVV